MDGSEVGSEVTHTHAKAMTSRIVRNVLTRTSGAKTAFPFRCCAGMVCRFIW